MPIRPRGTALASALLLAVLAAPPDGQAQAPAPVIDMHLHAATADALGPPPLGLCLPMLTYAPPHDAKDDWADVFMAGFRKPACAEPIWSAETDEALMRGTIEVLERRNVVGVVSGPPERVLGWRSAAPARFIPSAQLQIGRDDYSEEELRQLFEDGPFAMIGEVSNQYVGIAPDDERMKRYWAFAEEHDVPIAIHLGEGPAGAAMLTPDYRARLSSAFLLEDVLARHPKLRVSVMHYGSPLIEQMIAVLGAWPQVYVELGGIQWFYPRAYFYRQLEHLVDAGFDKRIMFGSDQLLWPGVIEPAIAIIEEAPFLSEAQKRDILYNNAARFLRLSDEEIAAHHGR